MPDIVIATPDGAGIASEMAPLVAAARAMTVTDTDSHGEALSAVKTLKMAEKKIEDYFEPSRKALDVAKKEVLKARDGLIAPLADARAIVDGKAMLFEAEQRKIAEAEQRRLQAEARKAEEDRQIAEAAFAEAGGDTEAAEEILSAPVTVATVTVAPVVAKVEGVGSMTRWSAEVTDKMALIRYVAEHPEWASLLDANAPNLNRLAVAQKAALKIPGVKAVPTTSRTVRG